MKTQIIYALLAILFLALLNDLYYVVTGMATKCEIKLGWGKYLDVSKEDWAKDWVDKCKNPLPKSEGVKTDFDPVRMRPYNP